LHGATASSVADELVAHRAEWNYRSWAKDLTRQPLLVIGASKAGGEENRKLADAVAHAGGQVTNITLTSDHAFQDHRIALAGEVIRWLQRLPAD
jgi:hypothetical protein